MRGTLNDAGHIAPLEPLLAPKDVARFLSCSPSSVRRLIMDGSLKPLRIAGRPALRFTRQQVEALVSAPRKTTIRKPPGSGGGTPSGSSAPPTP